MTLNMNREVFITCAVTGSGNTQNPHKIAFFMHTRRLPSLRKPHCVYSLLIPFKEDVPTFLIYCYSMIDQQLLLKQFCSNRLSF